MTPPYRWCGSFSDRTTICLSGARTATAMWVRPRIMTPSRTAWPPYETLGVRRVFGLSLIREVGRWADTRVSPFLLLLLGVLETALEALDLSSRVNQALLAGEERVARRADVDVEVVFGRPC